jgi:DNA-binding CsgD family transcriptional regulator
MNTPIPQSPLTEQDVRNIVRLLGEVIAATGNIDAKRRVLMEGLCELIHAESWVWCMAQYEPDQPPSFVGLVHGGFDDARFARFVEAINHPAIGTVTRPSTLELKAKGTHLTRTLRQIDPMDLLKSSPAAPYLARANIGTLLVSQRPMEEGGISAIGVYRQVGAPHFDERESRIAHILLSEVPWLHFRAFPDRQSLEIARLYPRHRTILNLLCEGWNRKKIADHLQLSVNTVHGYVKAIFQHFGVHSQAELLSRFTKGDGGDT